MQELTPKLLVLTLLGISRRTLAVRELVAIGSLFGFEQNAMRVAIARLSRRGDLENVGAAYALTTRAARLGRWAEEWRRGDRRLRRWRGDWLCVLHPTGVERTPRRKSARALERLGFRSERLSLWVRPDNLRKRRDDVAAELVDLGLVDGAEVFVGNSFSKETMAWWAQSLWPTEGIRSDLERSLREIEASRKQLDSLPTMRALVESYLVGDRAVRCLTRDPLLPDEICDGGPRRALTEALLEYDRVGRTLWRPQVLNPLLAEVTSAAPTP